MSEIKSNKLSPAIGTDVTLGDSGDTFTIPAGATIVNSGTATGFGSGIYSGTLSRDSAAATATVAYTGIGFQPKALIAFSTVSNVDQISWGLDDGITGVSQYDYNYGVAGSWANAGATGTSPSILPREEAAVWQSGYITSWDSDGFTIQWTKTGSPTGLIIVQYMVIG